MYFKIFKNDLYQNLKFLYKIIKKYNSPPDKNPDNPNNPNSPNNPVIPSALIIPLEELLSAAEREEKEGKVTDLEEILRYNPKDSEHILTEQVDICIYVYMFVCVLCVCLSLSLSVCVCIAHVIFTLMITLITLYNLV